MNAKLTRVGLLLVGSLFTADCSALYAPLEFVLPLCANAAPLFGTYDARDPLNVVGYHEWVDPQDETARLAKLHGFEPRRVFVAGPPGFAAPLSPFAVAEIRCEASVKYVSY